MKRLQSIGVPLRLAIAKARQVETTSHRNFVARINVRRRFVENSIKILVQYENKRTP